MRRRYCAWLSDYAQPGARPGLQTPLPEPRQLGARNLMIYKVSYVIVGGPHKGGIKNQEERPKIGDRVRFGRESYEVTEVKEIMPPRDDFQFLHATAKPIAKRQTGALK